MFKTKIKLFLANNFPNFFKILLIIKNNIILKKKNINFSGWGLETSLFLPWERESKFYNKTSKGFIECKNKLDKKIRNKEFFLGQIENYKDNLSFDDVLKHFSELTYRHYVVYYSAITAYQNTKSRNIIECGVATGMAIFFAINAFFKDQNYKVFLYDSWQIMRENELKSDKDLLKKGQYSYLDIEITKKNLGEYQSNIIFNKGYIPEIFASSNNPNDISWLHIDLNSSYATKKVLDFFYDKIESGGIILFDDYGHDTYEDTRLVVEEFFKDKKINFLQFMTGQVMVTKKE